ncbi:MAG TPA: GNAT family protein [Chitinophagaceae bacterium]|nr:GNAT family protein [Chitinophagaceae bacterium]
MQVQTLEMTDYEKFFPESLTLETPRVILRLMTKNDFEDLRKLTGSEILWKYFTKNLADDNELKQWIADAAEERKQQKRMAFVIIDKDEKQICGSTSLGNISFFDKRIEIGWSWLGETFLGTGVNKSAKFALMSYAFDVLKFERVEIKTDNQNDRAKAALRKIGALPEGVLRSHMQMWNDRRRDSIYFSVLKKEWVDVKQEFFPEMI